MTLYGLLALFFCGLILTSVSSFVLTQALERLGNRLNISEGLLGVLVALGANTPEISTAVTALVKGHHDLGLGVILGSNIFNLAALLGLSAVFAGGFTVKRGEVFSNGGLSLLISALIILLSYGLLSPSWTLGATLLIMLPYILILSRNTAVESSKQNEPSHGEMQWTDSLTILPALVSIVLGSVGMVRSIEVLGDRLNISHVILGTLVLATVTSIPNVIAAVNLANRNRGTAVLTEAFTSNNLNVLIGISIPALIFGVTRPEKSLAAEMIYLLAMTFLATILAAWKQKVSRSVGVILLGIYGIFVLTVLFFV
jgi:cation:H+ antiporter